MRNIVKKIKNLLFSNYNEAISERKELLKEKDTVRKILDDAIKNSNL